MVWVNFPVIPMRLFAAAILSVSLVVARATAQAPDSLADSTYARLVVTFSEPSGFFPSDNLVSNEDSYLHPLGTLRRTGVNGGAYLGVAPDQNFSYIAAVRPHIAFILDIRRDNLLEHAMFKAIFASAQNRLEYLCLLFGRPTAADTAGWGARDVDELLQYIDEHPADSASATAALERVHASVLQLPIPLSAEDLATLDRIHGTFVTAGPSLRWGGMGNLRFSFRPFVDYRQLIREKDRSGEHGNYLAREADFQFLKRMQARNLIVPVTGDFAGEKALASIAGYLRAVHEEVSMFYTSNVEQYLYRSDAMDRFARNVSLLPWNARSVFVRSWSQRGRYGAPHPQHVDGYGTVQLVQRMADFLDLHSRGELATYDDLLRKALVEP